MRVSIDIAEEYKTTVLRDHRQEKEKKQKKYTRLDWDVNTGNSTTRLSRGIPHLNSHPVGLGHNTGEHSKLQSHGGRVSQVATTTNLLLPRKSPSKHDPTSIRSREKHTAPHREGHRHAGAYSVVPLQHHRPLDSVISPDPDHSTTRGGLATSAVELHSRRLEETPQAGALPRPPQYSMSQICLLCCHQNGG